MEKKKIPLTAIRRLSIYARVLNTLAQEGTEKVSSKQLGDNASIPSDQVRKDLGYFGQFGKPGKGYPIKQLSNSLKKILGLDKSWNVALVGAGNLGRALFSYPGFHKQGFNMVAVFDNNPSKVNKFWKDVKIEEISNLPKIAKEKNITIGIIAVPEQNAQNVADQMCSVGIKAILNFAPKRLMIPKSCIQANVDLAIELENLSYFLSRRK